MSVHGAQADWRDAAAYVPLLQADRSIFAWEWLRRDPRYRAAAAVAAADPDPSLPDTGLPTEAEAWGLHLFEAPELAAPLARPLWTAALHPPVLPAEACATGPEADMLDLDQMGERALVVGRTGGGEHLLISDGLRTIRVDVVAGALNGRARLRFSVGGIASAERPLLTLRRLIAFCKRGRFSQPLHRPEARARRWILLLRTIDALRAGADQRDIAEALLSGEAAELRWRSNTPSLRSQAQRLVRGARHMGGGGYRELLL